MTELSPDQREQAIAALLRASWPGGGHDGFPSKRTAEMLFDQAVAPLLLEAKAKAEPKPWDQKADMHPGGVEALLYAADAQLDRLEKATYALCDRISVVLVDNSPVPHDETQKDPHEESTELGRQISARVGRIMHLTAALEDMRGRVAL